MVENILMLFGFLCASYAIVANDSIQTLGTFLSSNAKRKWWVLWLFAGGILSAVLLYGWHSYGGDPSYGRLAKIPVPEQLSWIHIVPPFILLFLTRYGLPVSTTFLVLTIFAQKTLGKMLMKSLLGYAVAFAAAMVVYLIISKMVEKRFLRKDGEPPHEISPWWIHAQWVSTGFLWSQWLIQDLANIYVYLPRNLDGMQISLSLFAMLSIQAFILYNRGGRIQQVVSEKTNTNDIRSATLVDLIYGIVLFYFKSMNKIPMSTTWVFIGLLAGRELAITIRLQMRTTKSVFPVVGRDLLKAGSGLAVSVALALGLPLIDPSYNEPKSTETETKNLEGPTNGDRQTVSTR